MYSKHELLTRFYTTVDRGEVKIETRSHGFEYLKKLRGLGTLQYAEWKNGVFKYKLTNVPGGVFDDLVDLHLESQINLCVFFSGQKNNIFCFNLDSFDGSNKSLKAVAQFLREDLRRLNIEPLILKSGHGYHFWCRLARAEENARLQAFMKAMVDVAAFQAVAEGIGISNLQCICYPRHIPNDISIRLFGCRHSVTGSFNSVVAEIGENGAVLGEEASWRYFEEYMGKHTIENGLFGLALNAATELAQIVNK